MNQYKVDGRTYEAWGEMQCGDKQAHAPHSWNDEVMCWGPYFCKGVFTANEMNRDERIELKPCPFCGGKAVLIAEIKEPNETPRFWHVSCDKGCVSGWTTGVKQQVIDKWNTRTDREAVLVAALEQIISITQTVLQHAEPMLEDLHSIRDRFSDETQRHLFNTLLQIKRSRTDFDQVLKEYRGER